jgi:hypothetical protein
MDAAGMDAPFGMECASCTTTTTSNIGWRNIGCARVN